MDEKIQLKDRPLLPDNEIADTSFTHVAQGGRDYKAYVRNFKQKIENNLTTATTGSALDATQGTELKRLNDFNQNANRILFYFNDAIVTTVDGDLNLSIEIASGLGAMPNKTPYSTLAFTGTMPLNSVLKLQYSPEFNNFQWSIINDPTTTNEGADSNAFYIAKNIAGNLLSVNASFNYFTNGILDTNVAISSNPSGYTANNQNEMNSQLATEIVNKSHNSTTSKELAGLGITWGHINNTNQSIYGNKGLNTELISTWDSYVNVLESFFNAIAFVAEDSGMFLTDNCYMSVGGVWKFKHTGYHAAHVIVGYGKFNVFISTVSGTAGNNVTFVEVFTVDEDGILKIGIQPNVATVTHPVLYRNPTNGYIEQFTQLKQTSVASSATPTPTGDGRENEYYLTALAAGATFAVPSGTPANGNTLIIRIKDNGTARSLVWNAIYRIVGETLPTTTVANKTLYVGCIYNSADSKWDVVAVKKEA